MESTETLLLEALSLQIHLDGGSTYVTSIGDLHNRNNQDDGSSLNNSNSKCRSIERLLKQCSRHKHKQKLLTFLESYPDFFQVSNRSDPPHIVTLQPMGSECAKKRLQELGQSREFSQKEQNQSQERPQLKSQVQLPEISQLEAQIQSAASTLEQRVAYVLRQRISKIMRRARLKEQNMPQMQENQRRQQQHFDCDIGREKNDQRNLPNYEENHLHTKPNTNYEDASIGPASVIWLIRKCPNQIHSYTRLLPSRPIGILPQSEEWISAVIPSFVAFLTERLSKLFVVSTKNERSFDRGVDKIKTGGEDDCKRFNSMFMVDLNPEEKSKVFHSLTSGSSKSDIHNALTCMVDVKAVSHRILILLRDHHAPVGGVQLGRLLSDPKLRFLLGGIDLVALIHEHPILFEAYALCRDEVQGQWVMTLKAAGGSGDDGAVAAQIGAMVGNVDKEGSSSRLVADKVGTYSLTKPKIALAMAKVMYNIVLGGTRSRQEDDADKQFESSESLPDSAVAIDITSGVGGNTLALAKVFPNVIGYEIDANRFQLLQQNIETSLGPSVAARVSLKCCDSITKLGLLSEQYRGVNHNQPPIAVIVDPPWGGIDYRRNSFEEELKLGDDMPLSRVVSLVARHLAPVILGMKLPLSFEVAPFLERVRCQPFFFCPGELKLKDDSIRVATIKKMGRQLFVVLELT